MIGIALTPRPVTLVSTIGQNGSYNAAPFSSTAHISSKPLIICISFGLRKGQKKDTLKNIEFSHDFVVNVVDEDLIQQTVQTSADYPGDIDEIREVGLTALSSEKVKSPRIAESKVSFECQLIQKLELVEGQDLRSVVFGEVVLMHINDELWIEGKIDPSRLRAVGRLGIGLYCRTEDILEINRS